MDARTGLGFPDTGLPSIRMAATGLHKALSHVMMPWCPLATNASHSIAAAGLPVSRRMMHGGLLMYRSQCHCMLTGGAYPLGFGASAVRPG